MLLKAKASRLEQISSLSHVIYGQPKASTKSQHRETQSVLGQRVCNDYQQDVNYLNSTLNSINEQRVERVTRITEERKKFVKIIERKICSLNTRLIPVGSTSTGLIFDNSADVDLCLYTSDHSFYEDFSNYSTLRSYMFNRIWHLIQELKEEDPELRVLEYLGLPDSHVPLQIFHFKKGVSMDIQFPKSDFQAIRNTNLVKHYILADSRFPQVFCYMKRLFEVMGLRNSKGGLLSSYHLMMLTVHFLQCRALPKPVLPVLCSTIPHRVGAEVPIDTVVKLVDGSLGEFKLDWQSKNTQTPAELIFDMIAYYRNFDFFATQIYISRGLTKTRHSNKMMAPSMQLFDPYSPFTVCRSHFIPDVLQTAFHYINRKVMAGRLIGTFPHFSDAGSFRHAIEDKPWTNKLKCK